MLNKLKTIFSIILIVPGFISCKQSSVNKIFIEAESFHEPGGWVVDQQSMDVIGSSYILAHGLGIQVLDARTTINVPVNGKYTVWVRTRNWVAPWDSVNAPGRFQLLVDGTPLKTVFGTEGKSWHWQNGGRIRLKAGNSVIALHDLTGFEGRCDAILFITDNKFIPPEKSNDLRSFRRSSLGLAEIPGNAGEYDLVVVGGGMAGCCAAVSAARLGCKVALIQNRPVLGGNNSSEVRVGLSGLIYQKPFPKLGVLVDEIGSIGHWALYEANRDPSLPRSKYILDVITRHPEKKIHNAGPASNYGDEKKQQVVGKEPNIALFLNNHVCQVEKEGDRIVAVIARNILTGEEIRISGTLFADCTGDANLGYLAGADYMIGRETRDETGELSAPEQKDNLVMGTSGITIPAHRPAGAATGLVGAAGTFSDRTRAFSRRTGVFRRPEPGHRRPRLDPGRPCGQPAGERPN
jgi:hypothetical protein